MRMQHRYVDLSDLNARWDQVPLQGLGLSAGSISAGTMGSLGAGVEDEFPWMEYSDTTKRIQQEINRVRAESGLPPIAADGVLGPETCQAMKTTEGFTPVATCQSATPTGPVTSVAPPATEEVVVKKAGMGDTTWLIVGGLVAAGAVGAAIYYKRRRGV